MRKAFRVSSFRPDTDPRGEPIIQVDIQCLGAPVGAAFQVEGFLAHEDGSVRTVRLYALKVPAGERMAYRNSSMALDEPVTGGTLTLTLRPSVEVALSTVDMMEIWGEEIVIEGIPFEPNDKDW